MGLENSPWQHTQTPRGLAHVVASRSYEGRFGRMFRTLPAAPFSDSQLDALAAAMVSRDPKLLPGTTDDLPLGEKDERENDSIPAGYTYFGQFITHDLTFDPSPLGERINDPEGMLDFRTPRFDLDSLYGRGHLDQPYLYDGNGKLVVGRSLSPHNQYAGPDLPRSTRGRAIIGDPRNDENKIISQLHGLFMRFHNHLIDKLGGDVAEVQNQVRWHYQYWVVHDFLPRIVPQALIDSLLAPAAPIAANGYTNAKRIKPEFRFFNPHNDAFVPVEFAAAAFRFGHSMIRPSYLINDVVRLPATQRIPLFAPGGGPAADLRGFGALPEQWGVQWGYFFDVRGTRSLPQRSFKIDEFLSSPLAALPDPVVTAPPAALARRTLQRGVGLGLPSGQDVADLFGLQPLSDKDLFDDSGLRTIFQGAAPLWYYILREANLAEQGTRLGPVGATIVAEVMLGLLWHDSQSYLRRNPGFQPRFGKSMAELIYTIGAPI